MVLNYEYTESYDVPSAYSRAATDAAFACYLRQPLRSGGSLTRPDFVYRLDGAQQGDPAPGVLWEECRDTRLVSLGWRKLAYEPGLFLFKDGSDIVFFAPQTA